MTQEEKAKRYDEALRRARKLKEDPTSVFYEYSPSEGDIVVDYIFPELKESEDERIRKTLIKYFDAYPKDYYGALKKSHILAWLEKQCKQKVSYATIVETGNGGINTLVTGELPIDGEQNPIEFKWSADDKNKLLIIEQILNCANLLISSHELTETKNWLKSLKQRVGE